VAAVQGTQSTPLAIKKNLNIFLEGLRKATKAVRITTEEVCLLGYHTV
jgi:hypothetical protein